MKHTAPSYMTADIRPDWAICDRVIDITDIWQDMTDPKGERDEICEAFMHAEPAEFMNERHEVVYGTSFVLRGICITDDTGRQYHDREWAIRVLGMDGIWRAEALELELN